VSSLALELPGVSPELLPLLGAAAGDQRVALVGGVVRDWLLHRVHNDPWRGLIDLDLVVEGSAAGFVGRLEAALRQADGSLVAAREHAAYGTVELELRVAGQKVLLDVATARSETYPQPGENPVVAFGSLEDDLRRRDFTINAMAVLLEPFSSGRSAGFVLLDPYGGQQDLEQRQLRFLHGGSVADDPTRLVRGARYAARLGFALEPASLAQARSGLMHWPWSWRHGDAPGQAPPALGTRLRMELELLLEREPWSWALAALQAWDGLQLLDPALQADRAWPARLRWARRLELPLMPALLVGASDPLAVSERLQVPHRHHKLLAQWLDFRGRWLSLQQADPCSWQNWTPGDWCEWLEKPGLSADAVALALVVSQGHRCLADRQKPELLPLPRRPLLRWLLRWRYLKAPVNAAELMVREGLRPGPALGARLSQLRLERLAAERS